MNTSITTIDEYIESFPKEIQVLLNKMRTAIQKAAPKAEEAIKYGMPTYVQYGNLVHFAGCKTHIGFYPSPSGITNFEKELKGYKTSKGAIQFPLDQPIPLELVKKITSFRLKENKEKYEAKKKPA
ncbi:DUF1801 domain-containing protein [Flavihumibacter sp. CACIAM 22H1]|uniref:iron chaperone n=1 Tax=Flavihumibacter sp. CACIAM 22H1 TaxID=1812911 RepID=UPI0007A93580|nr:DUF1801 domain-containing protein [Flavihumibacter sp. CACIAM 22H1]KYP12931.1 MAG: hypothetical protein A1D16_19455 [Flavihumibacter sp. CACIAM 22H1]